MKNFILPMNIINSGEIQMTVDVFQFMKIYTDLPLEQIKKYEQDKQTNINEFKKILAYEATKICHGEKNAKLALETKA